jgi:hypothetical protein
MMDDKIKLEAEKAYPFAHSRESKRVNDLRDAFIVGAKCERLIVRSESVAFAKWLKHIDNGTEHYNPHTKEKSESIGFSPYECFDEGLKTEEDLFDYWYNKVKTTNIPPCG